MFYIKIDNYSIQDCSSELSNILESILYKYKILSFYERENLIKSTLRHLFGLDLCVLKCMCWLNNSSK